MLGQERPHAFIIDRHGVRPEQGLALEWRDAAANPSPFEPLPQVWQEPISRRRPQQGQRFFLVDRIHGKQMRDEEPRRTPACSEPVADVAPDAETVDQRRRRGGIHIVGCRGDQGRCVESDLSLPAWASPMRHPPHQSIVAKFVSTPTAHAIDPYVTAEGSGRPGRCPDVTGVTAANLLGWIPPGEEDHFRSRE